MIKGDKTLDGVPLASLNVNSRRKVIRICDICGKEDEMSLWNIYKQRNRGYGDRCKKCGLEVNKKRHRVGFSITGKGQIEVNKEDGTTVVEHRYVVEQAIGRKLESWEPVHHLDGNKINNQLENLFLCENERQHRRLHVNLEQLAVLLYQQGYIKFDKILKHYYIDYTNFSNTSLGFDKVGIKQKKNICTSRLDVDTNSEIIKGVFVKTPLIAANMSTVINAEYAKIIMDLGAFAVLHRAQPEDKYINEVKYLKENSCQWIPISIGVGDDQYELGKKLISFGANIIVIDIAHGYSNSVIELGRKIKKEYGNDVKVVVGNTTNLEMLKEVADYADALKVGIAQGFACETMHTAGCAERQFSAVLKFKEASKQYGVPIISDGGISEPADFVKAIGAGASSVMAGKIFAACFESAAQIIEINGTIYKEYAGMASAYVQENWKGHVKEGTCAEGSVRHIIRTGPVNYLINWYAGALRSGITYGGGKDIKSFQEIVEFVKI